MRSSITGADRRNFSSSVFVADRVLNPYSAENKI